MTPPPRGWRLAALLLGALAGWWIGGAAVQATAPRGVTYGVPPAVAHADRALGVNVHAERFGDGDMAEARAAGIRWVRLSLAGLDRTALPSDEWLARARASGFRVLVALPASPDLLAGLPPADGAPAPNGYFHDWRMVGARMGDLATVLRGRVDAYQVGDEPNLAARWGGGYPNPADYAVLLREAAINIRAADPDALIVSAALAPTTESGPLNLNEPEFLRGMYRGGAREFFDALGAEPFGFWSGPDDRRVSPETLNFSRLILQREAMVAHGDGDKAIWATAFGWRINGAGGSPYGGDSDQVQTARTLDAIRRARDEWHWLGPLTFARWAPLSAGDARDGFALKSSDGSPGLLLSGLATETAANRGRRPATIGRYFPDDPSAAYPPSWRATREGADPQQNDNSPLRIAFRGTRVDLAVRRGAYEGVLFATVDGMPANALPRDAQGRAYLVLFDPLGARTDVTVARNLPDGDHVVELVPQGGWGQWAIAGWAISRERDETLWRWAAALMGAALAALLMLPKVWRISSEARMALRTLASASWLQKIAVPAALAAGTLLYLSPSVALSWALIAVVAVLSIARLEAGLALVALALPFYLQPKPLGAGVYSVPEIALVASAVAFVLRRLLTAGTVTAETARRWWRGVRWNALDGVVALWVVAGGIGVLVADNFGVANREFRVVFLEPAIYYALVRASGVSVLTLVHAFLLGGALVSAKAIADWFTGTDLIRAEGVLRARGTYFSPNNLALYLDRAAPVALALALFARDAGRARRALYAAAFALMLGALYLTFAKGAWLLALPVAMLTIGLARGRRAAAVALLALVVLAATLLPVLGTTRLQSLLDFGSGTTFVRLQLWQAAIAMLRDHWLWGVGPDNFLYHYRTTYILPTAFAEAGLSHPHNVLLDFWTRLGLLGVLLLATLTGVFWGTAVRRYRALPDGTQRALVLGTMGAMAAALAHGLIDNSFFLVDLAFALMLMLAIVARSAARSDR